MDIALSSHADNSERVLIARRHLDAAESWLRRIIHHQLSTALGATYLTAGGVLKNEETVKLKAKINGSPGRYGREIDATTFEQAKRIVCHQDRWERYFSAALTSAYPLGRLECALFLDRLIEIRNALQHGGACGSRQLEKAVCYTNDLSDSIKAYFRDHNMQRMYDVPMFVKYVDSLGNQSTLEEVPTDMSSRIIDWRSGGIGDLRPGELMSAEVEVDPTFDPENYTVVWSFYREDSFPGTKATLTVTNKHVGEQLELIFRVKSNKDWHRSRGWDDRLTLLFRVLPPLA